MFTKFILISVISLSCCSMSCLQAAIVVNEITTDFGGGWTSGDGTAGHAGINPIQPNNSHNLISFRANGINYNASTTWRGMPVSTALSNEVMYGSAMDGTTAANIGPPPFPVSNNNVRDYLNAGSRGMDLGTASNNSTGQTFTYSLITIDPTKVNDGIADLLFMDVAVSRGGEQIRMLDYQFNTIGTPYTILSSDWNKVGNWRVDRWNVNTGLPAENNSSKEIHAVAIEFSDIIQPSDLGRLALIEISIPVATDVAFLAYNGETLSIVPGVAPEPSTSMIGFVFFVKFRRQIGLMATLKRGYLNDADEAPVY
jgi:hypothetical protein